MADTIPFPADAAGRAGDASSAVSLAEIEALARAQMPAPAYEFIASGAADELTVHWNRQAFDRIRLRPRVLQDAPPDTRITLFGEQAFPIFLAPTAYHRAIHPEGELATARGACAASATWVVSSGTNTSIEAIARETTAPLWFQLYIHADRGFFLEIVRQAEEAGCRALCLTVDTPVLGARDRQRRSGFQLSEDLPLPYYGPLAPERRRFSSGEKGGLRWSDVDWLLSHARVPVLLKGIMTGDDAARSIDAGVAGVVVSNHGGRNLDTLPAAIDALPEVADRVSGRIAIVMDGGVRRGTDVIKAIALGANAVMIGRPYLYGLALGGAAGVRRVVEILRTEFEQAMALTGRKTVAEIDRTVLWSTPP